MPMLPLPGFLQLDHEKPLNCHTRQRRFRNHDQQFQPFTSCHIPNMNRKPGWPDSNA